MRRAKKNIRKQIVLQRLNRPEGIRKRDIYEEFQSKLSHVCNSSNSILVTLDSIPDLEAKRGLKITDVADRVSNLPHNAVSNLRERRRNAYFRYLLEYLIVVDLQQRGELPSSEKGHEESFNDDMDKVIEENMDLFMERIKKHELDSMFQSMSFWVVFLHQVGVKGNGRITPANAAHTNLSTTIYQAPHPDNPSIQLAVDSKMLDEEASNIIKSLKHPTPSDTPIKLKSLLDIFVMLYTKLRDYDIEIDSKIREKAMETLTYNAVRLNWYPTANGVKLWITEKQIKSILAGVWSMGHWNVKPFADTLLKLTIHTLLQILDLTGVRQGSLLDYGWRQTGEEGIYLRWHHIDISLIGYTDNQEPIFVMHGNAPPSKTGRIRPGQKSQSFMSVSTEHNGEFSVDRDPVIGIVGIAILQNCCGPSLRRTVEDSKYGKNLLSQRPDGIHTFAYQEDFINSPVFIKESKMKMKHGTDNCPLGQYKPLTTDDFKRQLYLLGKLVGFQDRLSYLILRRSYNMKNVLSDSFPSWRLSLNMGHEIDNFHLHRHVYMSSLRPVNAYLQRFGVQCVSQISKNAISELGTLSNRPDPALFEPERREAIRQLLVRYIKEKIDEEASDDEDDEEDEGDDLEAETGNNKVTDEDIIHAYQEINGGVQKTLKQSLVGIKAFAENDDWSTIITNKHPYVEYGHNRATDVVDWLVTRSQWQNVLTFVPSTNPV